MNYKICCINFSKVINVMLLIENALYTCYLSYLFREYAFMNVSGWVDTILVPYLAWIAFYCVPYIYLSVICFRNIENIYDMQFGICNSISYLCYNVSRMCDVALSFVMIGYFTDILLFWNSWNLFVSRIIIYAISSFIFVIIYGLYSVHGKLSQNIEFSPVKLGLDVK